MVRQLSVSVVWSTCIFNFVPFEILFPLVSQAWYAFKCLMSSDTVHKSTSLFSCFDCSDIIFTEFKKLHRRLYSFLSKILTLPVFFFLCLYLLTKLCFIIGTGWKICCRVLHILQKWQVHCVEKNPQNIHQTPDLRSSPFQGCQIIPRYCSLLNNFLIISHQS